jgi:hypothetical protein
VNIGDRVELQEQLGPCPKGCVGTVVYIDHRGFVTVHVTNNALCQTVDWVLEPEPPGRFAITQRCAPAAQAQLFP